MPVALAPVYTASKWTTIASSLRQQFETRKLTNAEATALIREWRAVSHAPSSLWYQFAAQAYGWSPPKFDALDTSAKRAAKPYPAPSQLWHWTDSIATELDERADGQPPRLAPDKATFADPAFYGDVRAHLLDDGAMANLSRRAPKTSRPPAQARSSPFSLPLLILGAWWVLTPRKRRVRR